MTIPEQIQHWRDEAESHWPSDRPEDRKDPWWRVAATMRYMAGQLEAIYDERAVLEAIKLKADQILREAYRANEG